MDLLIKKVQSGATNLIGFYIALNWGEKMVFAIQKENLVDIQSSRFRDMALCSKERRVIYFNNGVQVNGRPFTS